MSKTKDRIHNSQLQYKQGLGQNFLYDEDLLASLVTLAGVTAEDDVLEIGPGAGTMTKHLCKAAHHVLSIELDERLIPLLTAFMESYDNFTLKQGDVMRLNLPELTAGLRKPFSVVANIPYYITTPLITLLLTAGLPLKQLSLMVQKEVAEKVLSGPGEDGWGMLALRCQYLCEPRLALDVPAACFTPPPKVDSAFLVMPLRDKPPVTVKNEDDFFRVAQAGFALRRKTMTNGLCAAFHLSREDALGLMSAAGLDDRVRGEKLTMEELARLSDAYTAYREEHA
ncbi:MAG: ribosomal RNA small subunit methyltransferase A [Christensenellaceae bacterium]|nr:ribosomal RNA small subunit methyltransferase A [Christensenellaceae bacterium]